jgi:hypothetical protein
MKTKLLIGSAIAIAVSSLMVLADSGDKKGLIVHEWGTFTSFQGGDGVLLSWKPLVTSALPKFVYDWKNPGLARHNYSLFVNKGEMITLQRMETPVVYFYSDRPLTADLSVQFPQGRITEWYPQAREVGPSWVPLSKSLSVLDWCLHKCGAPARYSLAATFAEKPVTNSVIRWSNIRVLGPNDEKPLPTDATGSHYFAARQTDANRLHLDSYSSTNPPAQYEKFLFYRGVGSFATPLEVTMESDDAIMMANTGKEPLKQLFVLDVKDKSGAFVYVPEILPGEKKTVARAAGDTYLSAKKLADKLSHDMEKALVKAGLYPREAAAMVNTWKSSWFAEDGTRILYVLPRAWTDGTLPMTLKPAPVELTRVMVGRAEILTPGVEKNLALQLDKVRDGDSSAVANLHQIAASLGRFAEPAFYKTVIGIHPQQNDYAKLAAVFFDKRVGGVSQLPAFE